MQADADVSSLDRRLAEIAEILGDNPDADIPAWLPMVMIAIEHHWTYEQLNENPPAWLERLQLVTVLRFQRERFEADDPTKKQGASSGRVLSHRGHGMAGASSRR